MSCCSNLFQKAEEKNKTKQKKTSISKGQQKQEALLEQSCHPFLEAAAQ